MAMLLPSNTSVERVAILVHIRKFQCLYIGVLISFWLSKGILFLQGNAVPHEAAIMHQKFADLHFEILKHPA